MSLSVDKLHSLQDEPLNISASGLTPFTIFEIKLLLKHELGTFRSYAVFKSDSKGIIDLAKDSPIRGTYAGARPMGLFESVEPLSDFRQGGYTGWTPPTAWQYKLILSDICGKVLDEKTLSKNYMSSNVERIEVKHGKIRGAILKPKGSGPFPTILDMTGTGGGLREHRAALFASHGFCVLALAFFSYEDLTDNMLDVELEYFLDAIDWLTSLPYTSNRIGVHGNSFGGAIVLLLAKYSDKVKAVVSINPPHFMSDIAHIQFKGEPVPHTHIDPSNIIFRNDYLVYDKVIQYLDPEDNLDMVDFHPEEASKDVAFRFVASFDDQSTSAIYSVKYYAERLKREERYVEVHAAPGGHLMEPPYFPHHSACYSKFGAAFMAYGGEASLHGMYQPLVWSGTLDFFRKTLEIEEIENKSKL